MTPKERAAMQQALEALEELFHSNSTKVAVEKYNTAHNAMREALDHSGEANEMVIGWDRVKPEAIASDPLYQQGFVDGVEEGRNQVAEQAEQEPVAWADDYGAVIPHSHKLFQPELLNEYTHPLYTTPVSIEAAVLAEREACAKVCEPLNGFVYRASTFDAMKKCAAAIRERGGK